ncbi:MAG TPA: chemotaxis protein CheW [Leptospiraceae bacterium]|nr:chemotaxis protein CheW [Leptospiraceae bacterium]HMW06907.1 chemotaxis protein CheW [Leptospiraceae bacterium]HMX32269.1 chemotaxis protein CheW [Leptospiraceae bacterium]HMY33437.1 chemotaxis protein CheW [Leptospiraceae bacterium]HMZ65471.1 chemotaxis protein CheW [Leptospiraceae bacterium]
MKNKKLEILTWYVGENLYGLFLKDCKEVIKNVEILPIPHSKNYISGILNLRGEIITVLDAVVKLGYPKESIRGKKSIIRLKEKSKVSIVADKIYDIIEISSDRLENPPSNLSDRELKCIEKVVNSDQGAIVILNLNGITEIE